MYSYVVHNQNKEVVAQDQCAFGSLVKVIDFYGEQNFIVTVKKVVDPKGLRD